MQPKKPKNYIYIISNEAFPGWLKIGKTRDIKTRLCSYNVADPLKRYKVEYILCVDNTFMYESVFKEHSGCNSEWTQINLSDCIKAIVEINLYELGLGDYPDIKNLLKKHSVKNLLK